MFWNIKFWGNLTEKEKEIYTLVSCPRHHFETMLSSFLTLHFSTSLGDWDGLLEEAKRKQSFHPTSKTPPASDKKNTKSETMVALADHKNPKNFSMGNFHKENILILPILTECETASSKVSPSENSTSSTGTRSGDTPNRGFIELHGESKQTRRVSSSPERFRTQSRIHRTISRNNSEPLTLKQTDEFSKPSNFTATPVCENISYRSRTSFNRTLEWNTKTTADEYDIMLNQC